LLKNALNTLMEAIDNRSDAPIAVSVIDLLVNRASISRMSAPPAQT
jgi:hypothetical protein